MVVESLLALTGTCCAYNTLKHIKTKEEIFLDELTQVYNRKIIKKLKKLEDSGKKFIIVGCDIDHFKNVNDTYGHQAGDLVLKAFAQILKTLVKKKDYIVRFGGEEFFVFFSEPEKGSREIFYERVEDIRKELENLEILTVENELIKVTSSFGICFDYNKDIETKIKEADEFLYEAKNSGRNKVCCQL